MHVTIIHPDLGIGGAERLVVDVATAIRQNGHEVQFVVNRYNPQHAFAETADFDIKTVNIFPRSFYGFGCALCAYIRMCFAALYVCIFIRRTEVIFCDSISSCLLIFRLFRLFGLFNAPLIFYCHFPDQLLTYRENVLKKVYRAFIDCFETWTIAMADLICVNSEFTKRIVQETFPKLRERRLYVLYPTLNATFFDSSKTIELREIPPIARHIFLSINRYERKKNIALALEAFSRLKEKVPDKSYQQCFLVIAGGYDILNDENVVHFAELQEYALKLSLEQYIFLKSPNGTLHFVYIPADEEKLELLRRATAVLYTPSNEHFGIVPVEAMYMKCCVIAPNSGGPRETIVDHETGFLVNSDADSFAEKMAELVIDERKASTMGDAGRKRVQTVFMMEKFAKQLEMLLHSLVLADKH